MVGLGAEVHEFAQLEERHLHDFQERFTVADIHYSPQLGNGSDYARVYTRGCTETSNGGEFCEACAIAFTATTDAWDFEEDLNINLTPFCGLSQVHAGFVSEMRSYMNQPQWATAVSMMTADRCLKSYAVGTSLGGAMATLFAFCANQANAAAEDLDKAKFAGHFDMIPITTGAPAVAKEQVYNGQPGQCFRGARVVIAEADVSELDAEKTIVGLSIISSFLEINSGKPHAELANAISSLGSLKEDVDEFAKLKTQVFDDIMPSIILELKDLLMTILVPDAASSADASGSSSLMKFASPLIQLLPFATSQMFMDVLPALDPPYGSNQPVTLSPNLDFDFEYDVTPGLLSGFNFQHAMVPYYRLAHPEGQQPDHIFPVTACDASAHLPKVDFLKVFYATLGSFVSPMLAQTGGGGFPNHHLCCYFRGITGDAPGSCGYNQLDGSSFTCPASSWR